MRDCGSEEGPYTRPRLVALAVLLAAAAALRLAKLPSLSLRYDELQSVTHADRPFPLSLLSALLSDPHPPLYYEILSGWMGFGRSDAWVLLLSVLIGLALVASVYHVGFRLWGTRVAFFAALVCALHPLALFWSHHARMYGLVMLLSLWAYHANARLLEGRGRAGAAVVAIEWSLVYSHVAAPFALLFVWAALLPQRLRDRAALVRWARVHAVVAAGALPYLYFPLTTDQLHMQRPGGADIVEALSLFTNGVQLPNGVIAPLGALVFAAAAGLLLAGRHHRVFAASLLVAPFAVAALVSHALKPIWYAPRTFAFLVPFAALGFAQLYTLEGRLRPAGKLVALLALALLARGAVAHTLWWEKSERFVDAAREVREGARPGDLVLVPTLKDKWAFAWYFVGPDWDRALLPGTRIELWQRFASLDGLRALVGELGAFGRAAEGEGDLPILPAGGREPPAPLGGRRVWIVARVPEQRAALIEDFALGGAFTRFEVAGLDLTLCEPRPSLAGWP